MIEGKELDTLNCNYDKMKFIYRKNLKFLLHMWAIPEEDLYRGVEEA